MPCYLVERTFSAGASAGADSAAAGCCEAVIRAAGLEGVTWVQSFVTPDRRRSFCIVDAPSPEAIRVAAHVTALPVDRITEVRVLDPHAMSLPAR
ncbi:MAG: DUF4242 domain-containing protein [Burkholderiaceae bacterium]